MNNIAITQYVALHALQIQNVKRNVVKKIDINELKVNSQTNVVEPIHITKDSEDITVTNDMEKTSSTLPIQIPIS
jgi:hypothetical protein